MSHMKWIYAMIVDNTYPAFKAVALTAKQQNIDTFKFEGSVVDTAYAMYVIEYVDKHAMPAYDKHLTRQE